MFEIKMKEAQIETLNIAIIRFVWCRLIYNFHFKTKMLKIVNI